MRVKTVKMTQQIDEILVAFSCWTPLPRHSDFRKLPMLENFGA